MDMLIHISQQFSNSTTPAYSPAEFTVSPSIAAVNVTFFLSLALILIDAFLAMPVKSWLQDSDRSWRKYTMADLRAQEWERRLQVLERWKLAKPVIHLLILTQTSLLFYCISLIVLLPIHLISAILTPCLEALWVLKSKKQSLVLILRSTLRPMLIFSKGRSQQPPRDHNLDPNHTARLDSHRLIVRPR